METSLSQKRWHQNFFPCPCFPAFRMTSKSMWQLNSLSPEYHRVSDVTQLKVINPLDYPEWDKLVLSTRDYSFFHSSAWVRVLYDSYGYRLLYFTLINDGRLL